MNADARLADLSDEKWNRLLDGAVAPEVPLRSFLDSLSSADRECLHVALVRWIHEPTAAKALLVDGLDPCPDDYWVLSPLARKLAMLGARTDSLFPGLKGNGKVEVRLLLLRRLLEGPLSDAAPSDNHGEELR